MELRTVGVIGAGVMGTGVANNLAQAGYPTLVVDLTKAVLDQAKARIEQDLRFQGMFNPSQRPVDDAGTIMNRIRFATDYDALGEAAYVIENVVEKWAVKKEVYARISSLCAPECIFAVNTSAISITRVAGVTDRPDKVIGIHFMNPVPMKTMVEVIRGYHTTDQTIDITRDLLQRMGKESVIVNDYPGFVSNRVLMLTVNEAVFLVQDGVAPAEDVDKIFKGCFGHKMGPLETADLIGLDTILYSLDVLYESYNDPKFRPAPLLKKMVAAGLHGRKSGEGFHTY